MLTTTRGVRCAYCTFDAGPSPRKDGEGDPICGVCARKPLEQRGVKLKPVPPKPKNHFGADEHD